MPQSHPQLGNVSFLHHWGSQLGPCAAKMAALGLEWTTTGCGTVNNSSSLSNSAHSDSTLKGSGRNDLGGLQWEQQWLVGQMWAFWPQGKAFGCQWRISDMAIEGAFGMLPLGVGVDIASLGLCVGTLECAIAAPQGVPIGALCRQNCSIGAGTDHHGMRHSNQQ